MSRTSTFHEDVFYEYFRPYRHPEAKFEIWGGHGLETFSADLALVRNFDQDFVWTVIDGERDQWIVPGFRYVNRVCYLLTEVPHRGAFFEFRVSPSYPSLTPLGLARRLATVRRLLSDSAESNHR